MVTCHKQCWPDDIGIPKAGEEAKLIQRCLASRTTIPRLSVLCWVSCETEASVGMFPHALRPARDSPPSHTQATGAS